MCSAEIHMRIQTYASTLACTDARTDIYYVCTQRSVCAYICIYTYIHVNLYIHMYLYICIHQPAYIHAYIYNYIYIYVYACVREWTTKVCICLCSRPSTMGKKHWPAQSMTCQATGSNNVVLRSRTRAVAQKASSNPRRGRIPQNLLERCGCTEGPTSPTTSPVPCTETIHAREAHIQRSGGRSAAR